MPPSQAVICVSSHVVRGTVGNRAIVFTLERLGFPVWAVPTVILPWHPGHGPSTRIVTEPQRFAALMDDLARAPWLGEVGGIVSGYLGDADQAAAVAALVAALKARNPRALYLCDPVIGDRRGLYVPETVAAAIRDRLMPLADIATPNRFELEWLAGAALPDNGALAQAARAAGPPLAIVTSAFVGADNSPAKEIPEAGLGNLLATREELLLATHPKLGCGVSGTGDLMSALLLARLMQGLAPADALVTASASVYETVRRAGELGLDELALESSQPGLVAPKTAIALSRLDEAGRVVAAAEVAPAENR